MYRLDMPIRQPLRPSIVALLLSDYGLDPVELMLASRPLSAVLEAAAGDERETVRPAAEVCS
jgi:hypothetical protein